MDTIEELLERYEGEDPPYSLEEVVCHLIFEIDVHMSIGHEHTLIEAVRKEREKIGL